MPSVPIIVPELDSRGRSVRVGPWCLRVSEAVKAGELLNQLEDIDGTVYSVLSPVDGNLRELLVPEGALVRAGNPLAVLDGQPVRGSNAASLPKGSIDTERSPLRSQVVETRGLIPPDVPQATETSFVDPTPQRATHRTLLSPLRRQIGERMKRSLANAPQLTTVIEIDMTSIGQQRVLANGQRGEARPRLTYLPFIGLATTAALLRHPTFNAWLDRKEIVYEGSVNLGFAVDTSRGLLVPVVPSAEMMTFDELAESLHSAVQRARKGKLSPFDLHNGTFTITNTGSHGSLHGTPILNEPQVAMLATGAVTRRPMVTPGELGEERLAFRSMAYFSLTYDHRLIDGADAGRFLTDVKTYLEHGPLARATVTTLESLRASDL